MINRYGKGTGTGKFMKRGIMVALIICMLIAMVGCGGGKDKEWTSFTEPLAGELMKGVNFSDELASVDMNLVSTMYGVDETKLVDYKVLMSSGGTADEVAIFFAQSDEYAKELKKLAETRIEDQKSVMESYLPNEMGKLNNAVIVAEGPYVVLCVTDDAETAKEIIDGYFK